MNNNLRNFYQNENEREAVKLFFIETLGEMAKEKAFDGESVVGIKEARDMVERSFETLAQ